MAPKFEYYGTSRDIGSIGSVGKSIKYPERLDYPGYEADFDRAPYAATPINTHLLQIDGHLYDDASLNALGMLFATNLRDRKVGDTAPTPIVSNLLQKAIMGALRQRLDKHNGIIVSPDCSEEVATLYEKACVGQASPSELLELLVKAPEIKAIEIAKYSHPLKWLPEKASIDTTVDEAIIKHNEKPQYEHPEYYVAALDDPNEPSVVVMVRKIYRARLPSQDEPVHVIQRDMFIVDLTHPDAAENIKDLKQWLGDGLYGKGGKISQFKSERTELILNDHLDRDEVTHSRAIEPGVRSYYAFRGVDTIDQPS